jgi:hypothetical protein
MGMGTLVRNIMRKPVPTVKGQLGKNFPKKTSCLDCDTGPE